MPQTWNSIESSIYGNAELSNRARMIAYKKMTLLDAVEPAGEFALGRKSGDTVGFRLVGRLTTLATTALLETQTVPFQTPPVYHGTAVVARYATAIPWTGTRADLDRLDVEDTNIRTLRDHSARTHNSLINTALVNGRSFTYVCTGSTASPTHAWLDDGTVAGTAARNPQLYDLRKLKLRAVQNNIPPADGKSYWLYGSPQVEDGIISQTDDQSWTDIAKYGPSGSEGVLRGEIGMISSIRVAIDNDVIDDSAGATSYGSGFLLGEEAVKEVMVYPSHFRANMNLGGDFGNQQALAWQSMLAYTVIWNYTSHGQGQVVHITSA